MPSDRLRILFLSTWFPYPAINGSKLRVLQLLQELGAAHHVTLLSLQDSPSDQTDHPELVSLCESIEVWPQPRFDPKSWRARLAFVHPWPRSVIDTDCPALARRVAALLQQRHFDLVVASQLGVARYLPPRAAVSGLFDEVELTVLYEQFTQARTLAARARYGLTWAKHRRYVARVLRRFAACTVVSDRERELLQKLVPTAPPVTIIPNAVRPPITLPAVARSARRLMFNGTLRYHANHDAMIWFLQSIYPLVRAAVPEVELQITGDDVQCWLPMQPGLCRLGVVADVHSALATAAIAVVPLRIGSGTRFKILDALAAGTPVVSTSKGAEGLEVVGGEHLLLADTAEQFAAAVVRLLRDAPLAARLAQQGGELVRARYDWRSVGPRFRALAEQVARQC